MPVPYVMPVKNFSGEEIPPFAAMQIVAVSDDGFYLVQKPDTDGLISGILLNGPGAIPVTGNGDGHFQFPGIAHFEADTGDIPTNADTWGTKADSWYLWKDKAGFKSLGEGTTISGTKGYFNVMSDPASVVNSTTPFWIKITGQEYTSGAYTGKYSWVEQVESTAGAWTDKPSGRSSLFSGSQPGYEANLTNKVPIGKICLARMAEDGDSVRFVWAMGPSDIDICVERTGASGASYVTDVKTRFGSGDCESAPDCSDVCASTPDESCVEITCGSDTVNVCRSLLVDITGLVDGDCDTCFPPTERIQIDYIPDNDRWEGMFSNSCTTGMFFYFGCDSGSWYWKITKDANTTGNQSFDTESLDPFEMEDSSYIDSGALGDSICPPAGGGISVRVYSECVCEATSAGCQVTETGVVPRYFRITYTTSLPGESCCSGTIDLEYLFSTGGPYPDSSTCSWGDPATASYKDMCPDPYPLIVPKAFLTYAKNDGIGTDTRIEVNLHIGLGSQVDFELTNPNIFSTMTLTRFSTNSSMCGVTQSTITVEPI